MSQARHLAIDAFARWDDLRAAERPEEKVKVYGDQSGAFRDDDIKRVEHVSAVVTISDVSLLRDLLAARSAGTKREISLRAVPPSESGRGGLGLLKVRPNSFAARNETAHRPIAG